MSRFIIVEDEFIIAALLETYLQELECDVVGIAANVQQALRMAMEADFDYALLDINLNGQKAHAVPGVLARRKKPFAFVTGYGEKGILDAYASAPVVSKPFDKQAIANAIEVMRQSTVEMSKT